MTGAPWFVLFDIDGTLIRSGRAGLRSLNAACEARFGVAGALAGVSLAGRTDRAILTEVLLTLGREAGDEALDALRTAYLAHLRVEIARPGDGPSDVLPGVTPLLDALAARGDVAVGLLTGNFEQGARIKLGHFGLWPRFAFGAFGDAHADRRLLVPLALARGREAGYAAPPAERVVIVGDTPLDVDCAKAYGARAIAVATGPYSTDDLVRAGADRVFATLDEVADVADLLAPV